MPIVKIELCNVTGEVEISFDDGAKDEIMREIIYTSSELLHMPNEPKIIPEIKRSVKALLPEDKNIGGGYWIFKLPPGHPFTPAFQKHDEWFGLKDKKQPTIGRKAADAELLAGMLQIAGERKSFWLKTQAYIYFGLARAFGKLLW
jgi:hypothetical protein